MTCCEICATAETATERAPRDDARKEERQAPQYSGYTGEMKALFAEINAVTDNMATPTYSNEDELIQALQGLHQRATGGLHHGWLGVFTIAATWLYPGVQRHF